MSPVSAQTNQIIEALKPSLEKNGDDLRRLLAASITGFIFLIGAFGYGYLHLDDKLDAQNESLSRQIDGVNTRIDDVDTNLTSQITSTNELLIKSNTELDDLLARIPPQIQPIPSK